MSEGYVSDLPASLRQLDWKDEQEAISRVSRLQLVWSRQLTHVLRKKRQPCGEASRLSNLLRSAQKVLEQHNAL